MLTKCPECDLQVSDKAISCPHCGYPFKPEKISHTKKPKRLPNGFGQITKLKSNLRKTFVTLAKKYNLDEYAIKRIVGHTITDITEEVYTDRDFEWLKEEMQKIVCKKKSPC